MFAAMLHICSFGLQAFPALAQTLLRFKPTLLLFLVWFPGMPPKRVSRGMECDWVGTAGQRCCRSRDKKGLPILLNKFCKGCNQQRCKKHCGCSESAKGRSAARGVGTGKASRRVPQLPAPAVVPQPVGRASAPSAQFLDIVSFYEQCCSGMAVASEVEMASYMYDEESLHSMFLKRLKGRAEFKLTVTLDREAFAGGTPKSQKRRVKELKEAGATVFLCKGGGGQGNFHSKALVLDRRFLFTGGANFTQNSRRNSELNFRITGPAVAQVLAELSRQRGRQKQWDGD